MNYKKIFTLVILTIALLLNSSSFASKLPNDVWEFVKTNLPQAQQRFDSVLTIDNNTMYIPLYPPATTSVENIQIEYTYPANKTFKNLPEVVLLNNGYSFLKVIKTSDNTYTLTKKDDLPLKIRLGLMPQDMLTPVGLKIPESLKLTLGDILIPTLEEKTLAYRDDYIYKEKNPYKAAVVSNEFVQTSEFQNKRILINPKNSKFFEVYDNTSKKPLYELKLTSVPLKVVVSEKSNVALVLYWCNKKVEIIDLKDDSSITKIELEGTASDVALNKKSNVAYVACQKAKKIYCIDLNSMQLTKIIKLDQRPSKIFYNEFDNTLSFYDEYSFMVYNTNIDNNDYTVTPFAVVDNVSKILSDEKNIYAVSRTKNQIFVFNKVDVKLKSTIDLDEKPIDAILFNSKLFVLCSQGGYVDVYDTNSEKIISREEISKEGFYSKLTLMPDNKNILITGINTKNYLLYDIVAMKVAKNQTSYIDISNIIILDKNQRL